MSEHQAGKHALAFPGLEITNPQLAADICTRGSAALQVINLGTVGRQSRQEGKSLGSDLAIPLHVVDPDGALAQPCGSDQGLAVGCGDDAFLLGRAEGELLRSAVGKV